MKQSDCRTDPVEIPDALNKLKLVSMQLNQNYQLTRDQNKNYCPYCNMGFNFDNGTIFDDTRESCDATGLFQGDFCYGTQDCGQYYYFAKVEYNGKTHTLCEVDRRCGK